jgi:hypothetical protein
MIVSDRTCNTHHINIYSILISFPECQQTQIEFLAGLDNIGVLTGHCNWEGQPIQIERKIIIQDGHSIQPQLG